MTGGYIVEELRTGNIHVLILFLMVLAFFHQESGKTVSPSFFLALAICTKITPSLLLLYFALLKRWKICLFCLGWMVVLVLGPSLFIGWEKNIDLTKKWLDSAIARGDEPINHSLRGVLYKYLSEEKLTAETEKYPPSTCSTWRPERSPGSGGS